MQASDSLARLAAFAILAVFSFTSGLWAQSGEVVPAGDSGEVIAAEEVAVETETVETTAETAWPESVHGPLSLDSPYMTGDWAGARTAMSDIGITTQIFFNNTGQWLVKGGLERTSRIGSSIDYLASLDFEKMGLIPGGRGLLHVQRYWGSAVNPSTGALWQVQDDADGDRTIVIAQLWYEQELLKKKLWLKAGFLDFQTIFDHNKFSNSEDKQFMNQALDNNTLIPLNIGLGLALTYKPCDWFSLVTGVGDPFGTSRKGGFSTAFHDQARYIWLTEPAFHVKLPNPWGERTLDGNYRFGMIYDPRPRAQFVPAGTQAAFRTQRGDDYGFYASFDQQLYLENEKDDQGLGWFFRYAYRHGDVQRIQNLWQTGLAYKGLIPSREKDTLGAAVLQSIPSRKFNDRVNRWAEAETVLEVYYAIQVTPWLVITPDIQYISSPGIGSDVDDVLVLGLRTRISF